MEQPALTRIAARSRRQAMDWSLVLISQGIEAIIDYSELEAGWGLLVTAQEYQTALDAIRQYHLENRGWPWRQQLRWPGVLFDWGSVIWGLLLVAFYWISETRAVDLRSVGIMDSRAVLSGEWWRLFTAIMLHADLTHLASNVCIGIALLGLTMGRCGTGVGLLAAYFAGAGGNLVALLLYPNTHRGLGASGMILGSLGLLAAQSFSVAGQSPRSLRHFLAGVAGGVLLFVLLGLTPGTDVIAHLGGFVTGLMLGALIAFVPDRRLHNPKVNLAAGLFLGALILTTWWLALGGGK